MGILKNLFAQNESATFLKNGQPVIAAAAALSDEFEGLSREELQARLAAVRERTGGNVTSNDDIAEVFALVRETARRVLNERHYDVQLLGGLALAKGKIAEMRTGEGKTLVATLAATLRALNGKGVHLVTVNEYLARRDAAWMGQVYDYLGLTLGVVTPSGAYVYDGSHTDTSEVNASAAAGASATSSTDDAGLIAIEDTARDQLGSFRVFYEFLRPASKREAYAADITYATNNELGFDYLRDNTAFDETQVVQRGQHFAIVDEIDSILIDEARTPLIISGPAADAEHFYERFAALAAELVEGEDYTVDEKLKAIQLSEDGIAKAERALNIENLYTEAGVKMAHHLETAVRAKALFRKDREYVVRDGEVLIVDESTGRLKPGQRWSEGLHQAVEAKEGVPIQKESRTFASVTFQNYFRMYEGLSGMTGTALSSEEEFYTVYKLEVVAIPTHRKVMRVDNDDFIFQTNAGKYNALAKEVRELYDRGQPVLIGTVSIEDNDVVSDYLTRAGIPHEVLNAKNHEREGELIAQAGRLKRVTVATNLAGRGVDIKLGGVPANQEERDAVLDLGGLAVIGTERHEARRIDNQLRGRSGRQGDPGATRFYVSLEDKLMRVFASDMLKRVMGTFRLPEDEPIAAPMISRSLETAQKRIEGFNFDNRKQVLAYDDVLSTQRLSVYAQRNVALMGSREEVEAMMHELIGADEEAQAVYASRETEFGADVWVALVRRLILQVTDNFWLEHLETMDYLRRSVSLRGYGQRDPLLEYRREGLIRFQEMQEGIRTQILETLPRIMPADDSRIRAEEARIRAQLMAASEGSDASVGENSTGSSNEPIVKQGAQYGRNDLVTIRRGNETQTVKYKKAEAMLSEGWAVV